MYKKKEPYSCGQTLINFSVTSGGPQQYTRPQRRTMTALQCLVRYSLALTNTKPCEARCLATTDDLYCSSDLVSLQLTLLHWSQWVEVEGNINSEF